MYVLETSLSGKYQWILKVTDKGLIDPTNDRILYWEDFENIVWHDRFKALTDDEAFLEGL